MCSFMMVIITVFVVYVTNEKYFMSQDERNLHEDVFNCLQPMMTDKEFSLFYNYSSNIKTYLEWGMGGSTTNFATLAKETFYSIENNQEWCDKVESDECVLNYKGKVNIYCVPLEEHSNIRIQHLGFPQPIDKGIENFDEYEFYKEYGEDYVIKSIETLNIQPESLDFVFVDGRYRIACALYAFQFLKNDGHLGIHDYNKDWWRGYQIIEKYYDVVESVETAFVMKKKKNVLKTDEERKEFDALFKKYIAMKY